MSNSTLWRRATLFLLAVPLLAAAGCGSSGSAARHPSPSASTVVTTHACLRGAGARAQTTGGEQPVEFAEFGTGSRAVVLSNQSDEDLCAWLPFARQMASNGFRAVVYDYAVAPEQDPITIASYLRAHGVTAVALMGASQGGKGSIMAATAMRPAPQAVVTLSAEEHYGGRLIVDYARNEQAPILFVSAAHDAYSAAPAGRLFDKVAPAKVKRLIIVPGSAHGTALLAQPAVVASVLAFLAAHDR